MNKLTPKPLNDGCTIECVNLRMRRGKLTSVGKARILATGIYKPLLALTTSSGARQVIAAAPQGVIVVIDCDKAKVTTVGVMADGNTPTCAVAMGNQILLMPSAGDYPDFMELDPTGEWSWREGTRDLESLSLVAEEKELVSTSIPGRTFSGSYSARSASLDSEDTAQLTKELVNAYYNLCDRAAAHQCYVQPVMARYRLRNHAGKIIYESCPKLIVLSTGPQLGSLRTSFSLSSATGTMGGVTFSARAFQVGVRMPTELSAAWENLVGRGEVLVSPQIHPLAPELNVESSISGSTLTLSLPGFASPVASPSTLFHSRILTVLTHLDKLLVPCNGYNCLWGTAKKQISGLDRLMQQPVAFQGDSLMARLSSPHSFTAATVTTSGNTLLWGNLKARLFNGYSLREMALTHVSSASQPTAVKVTLDSGENLVTGSVEEEFVSTMISPLVVYPLSRAVSMEIHAGLNKKTIPLSASPDGKWAYFLHPSCCPFPLDQGVEAFVMPAANPALSYHPQCIAVADTQEPLRILAANQCGHGKIVSLSPAIRSQMAWDFATSRFYGFSSSGIFTLTTNNARDSLKVACIDSRGIRDSDSVTCTPNGVVAVSGKDLIMVHGSATSTLGDVGEMNKVGWNGAMNELWLFNASGAATIYSIKGEKLYSRDDIKVEDLLSLPMGLWLVDNNHNLLEAGTEQEAMVTCSWKGRWDIKGTTQEMHWDIFGTSNGLKINVSDDNGRAPQRPILNLTITGNLDYPIAMRWMCEAGRFLNLEMTGLLATNSQVGEVRIT